MTLRILQKVEMTAAPRVKTQLTPAVIAALLPLKKLTMKGIANLKLTIHTWVERE